MKWIAYALLGIVALAPLAAADYYEGKEECPPDMMCTTSAPAEPSDDPKSRPVSSDDEPTYGDCDDEMCAYHSHNGEEPHRGADCENCRTLEGDGSDDDYVKAPEGSEGGITSVEDDASGDKKAHDEAAVPAAALGAALAMIGLAAVAFRRKM